jgi:hypothetical protein
MTLSPESFSLSPLLSLLPSMGSIARLDTLVSSLFARYESVEGLIQGADDASYRQRLMKESAMLKQILDWLEVQPGGGGIDE